MKIDMSDNQFNILRMLVEFHNDEEEIVDHISALCGLSMEKAEEEWCQLCHNFGVKAFDAMGHAMGENK